MELGPDVPVVVGIHYEESPDLPFLDLPLAGAFPDHALKSEPAFIETFQQIIDGLPEQIALVDEDWTILAVNPAWTRTAALYDYGELTPGANYLAFCEKVAVQGHNPAGIAAKGIRDMKRNGQPSFSFVYHGKDRWEGFAFQLCVKWIEVAGRTMYTVTRYDVSELVHLRQMREEFSHSLIEHQDEERRRMAREVHDSTMQLVASLGLSLGQIRRSKSVKSRTDIVDEMEDLLAQIHRELRAISFLAHPPMVSELGLAKAVRQLAGGFARRTGLTIAVEAAEGNPLSPAAEVAVFRMAQEALSNVYRHAKATHVSIGLYQRRSMLHISIADDGVGLPEKLRTGVGLSSMRERIEEIGGRLMIRAGKPGMILLASVPLHGETRAVGDLALAV
ncbi:MAG TPA: sensor histidine kinase [Sphingomicrobium sp.]